MKKKAEKKLQVHRETLRDLNLDKAVSGGNTSGAKCTVFCVLDPNHTYYCCGTD